jgi:hypothetical protein
MQVIHNPSVTGMIKTSDFSDRREGVEGIMVNKDPLRNIAGSVNISPFAAKGSGNKLLNRGE